MILWKAIPKGPQLKITVCACLPCFIFTAIAAQNHSIIIVTIITTLDKNRLNSVFKLIPRECSPSPSGEGSRPPSSPGKSEGFDDPKKK